MNGKALWPEAVRVAVLSIELAVLLELLQVVFARVTGTPYAASEVLRDALLKVPWAIVVCVALWIAMRIAADRPAVIALIGLVAAPIGSLLALVRGDGTRPGGRRGAGSGPLTAPGGDLAGVEYAYLGLA